MFKVFSRPQIDLEDMMKFEKVKEYIEANDVDQEILEQAEIQVKYSGYIKRQLQQISRFKNLETKPIPLAFNYDKTPGFSREVLEKLDGVALIDFEKKPAGLCERGQQGRVEIKAGFFEFEKPHFRRDYTCDRILGIAGGAA